MTVREPPPARSPDRAETLIVSDLHLAESRPAITALFLRFLEDTAARAAALYILGDLFEYWIGDDDLATSPNRDVAHALGALSGRGTRVMLMHGNRDFLVAQGFAAAAGLEIIPDPTLVDLHGVPTLLMHGDTLCTDDMAYQAFRTRVRDPHVQSAFLGLPLDVRRQEVGLMRAQSEQQKQAKAMEIMDVTAAAVDEAFRAHGYPPRLIHGHTHRPAVHRHVVDGHVCERWVLADWHVAGEYLRVSASGVARVALPLL